MRLEYLEPEDLFTSNGFFKIWNYSSGKNFPIFGQYFVPTLAIRWALSEFMAYVFDYFCDALLQEFSRSGVFINKNIVEATYWNTEMWLIFYKSPTEQISNRNSVSYQYESDALSLSGTQHKNHDPVETFVELSNIDVGYGTLGCCRLTAATYIRHYIWNTSDQFFQQLFGYILSNCNSTNAYPCFCGITLENLHI